MMKESVRRGISHARDGLIYNGRVEEQWKLENIKSYTTSFYIRFLGVITNTNGTEIVY
nr:MAG TPA: hypothetical protein [Caudoviricetes sp.]